MKLLVYGTPATKGSSRAFAKRSGGVTVVPDNRPALKDWEQLVQEAGQRDARRLRGQLLTGPLSVSASWWLARPRGHFRTNGELHAWAPAWPTTKPDLDKLARAVFDALKGVWYADDAQLVAMSLSKHYAPPNTAPRLELSLEELT